MPSTRVMLLQESRRVPLLSAFIKSSLGEMAPSRESGRFAHNNALICG